jgi:hypothetical protein
MTYSSNANAAGPAFSANGARAGDLRPLSFNRPGDVGPLGLAAKLANSIGRSNTLHKTYAPLDIEAGRSAGSAGWGAAFTQDRG